MYGKSFASMYVGSMRGAGLHVFGVWNYCIANCDAKGEVEINADIVAFLLGCEAEQINKALEFLMSPDPNSRTKDEEGRRLLRLGQFSYKLVNHRHYQAMRTAEERREYFTNWKRAKRSKVDNGGQCGQQDLSTDSTHIDIYKDIDKDISEKNKMSADGNKLEAVQHIPKWEAEFEECWGLYPDKSGKTRAKAAFKKAYDEGVTQADILMGLNRYACWVRAKREGGFKELQVQNGATWFHQRGWENEYTVEDKSHGRIKYD
jgi:hypothetical protein